LDGASSSTGETGTLAAVGESGDARTVSAVELAVELASLPGVDCTLENTAVMGASGVESEESAPAVGWERSGARRYG
jgi:hypothetical protein